MQRQPHISFLGNREHSFNEVGVVGPHIVSRIDPVVPLLFDFLTEVVHVVLANLVTALRRDLPGRVGVTGVEIDLGGVDPQAAEDFNEGLELFNVLVASGLAQLDLGRLIETTDALVDLDAVAREPVACVLDELEIGVQGKLDVHPTNPDLLQEQELVVIRTSVDHSGDFRVLRVILVDTGGPSGHKRPGRYSLSCRSGQRELQKIPAVWAPKTAKLFAFPELH